MTPETVDVCAGLLLDYQGVVVHDLRGDLNGLLLTVDFLRRQLATKPEVAAMIGESLGDLDNVRGALNRTLSQLDLVGQARKTLAAQVAATNATRLNLADAAADVIRYQLGNRARRRNVSVAPPAQTNHQVRADPVLLHLTLQRMLTGWVDLGRDTEIRVYAEFKPSPTGSSAVLRATFAAPQAGASDAVDRASLPHGNDSRSGPVSALRLARCLAEGMGGSLRAGPGNVEICLELPAGEAPSSA